MDNSLFIFQNAEQDAEPVIAFLFMPAPKPLNNNSLPVVGAAAETLNLKGVI